MKHKFFHSADRTVINSSFNFAVVPWLAVKHADSLNRGCEFEPCKCHNKTLLVRKETVNHLIKSTSQYKT